MLLQYPIQSAEIKKINTDLCMQHSLYQEALNNDEKLSVKKEIRFKIKELEKRLQELKEISLGVEYSRQ